VFKNLNLANRDGLSSLNAVYRPHYVGPKAALSVGDIEAAQEVGDDIENHHANLAIGGNVLAVAFAKPRAYNQVHAPVQRLKKLRNFFGIMLAVCIIVDYNLWFTDDHHKDTKATKTILLSLCVLCGFVPLWLVFSVGNCSQNHDKFIHKRFA